MAPARRHGDIANLGAQAGGCPDIAGNAHPFVKRRPDQVEAAELPDNSVNGPLIVPLCLKGAKHPVPDDKDTSVIAVEIARVDRVMHAVVRRRVHHRLKPARHSRNYFGMNPELVDQVERRDEKDHRGWKTDQEQG